MDTPRPVLLNTAQVSSFLGLSTSTLAKWRLYGCGPRYSKLGRRVVYDRAEIVAWLEKNSHSSTSDYMADRETGGRDDQ